MEIKSQDNSFYYDLQNLDKLKYQSENNKENLQKVAKQFESIFSQMLLKSMREASEVFREDDIFNSDAMNMYQDIYDNQLSTNLSSGSGLGLADMIVKQFSHRFSGDNT